MKLFTNVYANQPSGTSSINRQRNNLSDAGRRAMENAGMGRDSNADRVGNRVGMGRLNSARQSRATSRITPRTGIARDGRRG